MRRVLVVSASAVCLLLACMPEDPNEIARPAPVPQPIPNINTPCLGTEPVVQRSGCNGCLENYLQCVGLNWSCISRPGICTPVDGGMSEADVPDGSVAPSDASSEAAVDVVMVTDAANADVPVATDAPIAVTDTVPPADVLTCTNGVGTCARTGMLVRNANGVLICQTAALGRPSAETCNGLDDDCDGATDENCPCVIGVTQSCYDGVPSSTNGVGACHAGTQICVGTDAGATASMWGACTGVVRPTAEICTNNIDDDCDGFMDEAACTNAPPL